MNRYIFISFFICPAMPLLAQKDSLWNKDLNEITISAERLDLYKTGSRTDKPDSLLQQIFKSSSLASLLDASGGLVIRSYGPGILATSSLRGGNAQQTALSWNGMSINSPVNGLSDLNLVPSFLFEGVSVLPGIAGSLQGSGAISGGINLSNTRSKQIGFSAELLQTIGSFGTYTGGLKVQFSKNKWTHATKGFYATTQNNYPFNNYAEPGNPGQNLSNAKSKTFSILHETGYQSLKLGTFKISYWGTFAERQIPPTLLMQSSEALQIDEIHKTMLQWDKQFKNISLKIRSMWQKDYLRYSEPELNINSVSKSMFITNDAELRVKLAKNSSTSMGMVQTFAKADVANYLITDTTGLYRSDRNQLAFWASHFLEIKRIRTRISGNIRQEIVDDKFLPFIPSLGFKTILHKNLDIFGQSNRVYKIPTLNDLYWVPGGNPELKPESGWASELSAEFHKKNNRINFTTSITAYSRLITNWIQWQPVNTQVWSPVNIGKVNSSGIEFRSTLNVLITKKLYGKAGLTFDYTQSENVDADNLNYRKQLFYIPYYKSSGFAGLGYNKTLLLISGIIVGKRYTSSDNLDSIPAYGLINIALNQNFKFKNMDINSFLRVNNILDKYYEAIAWRPMPGINYEFGINFHFGPRLN